MADSEFSLRKVLQEFNLSTIDADFLPADQAIAPSPYLAEFLQRSVPLGIAVGSEKARSEWLISPICWRCGNGWDDR